jgi:CspA family cold shock protein
MSVDGVVREWHSDAGWGVIEAPATPGGCWAHFSHIDMHGYRELTPGQAVTLEWELADQDGYFYRAVHVWPAGSEPVDQTADGGSAAFSSTLTVRFDDQTDQ